MLPELVKDDIYCRCQISMPSRYQYRYTKYYCDHSRTYDIYYEADVKYMMVYKASIVVSVTIIH